MANVKISKIGLLDMLYFKSKPKQREKKILTSSDKALVKEYQDNIKAAERHPDEQEFVIENITCENDVTKTYTLKKTDGKIAAPFRAGQYVVVRQLIEGKLIARPISISSSVQKAYEGIYTLTVRKIPDGFLSSFIFDNWKKGDKVKTSGPQGTFYYEGLRDSKNVIAVAGGSGITPLYSMAQDILNGDEDFNLTILYGCRKKEDILFKDEFDKIALKTNKVKVVYILSDEVSDGYESGFITADVIRKHIRQNEDYSIFAAGPQAMYLFLDNEVKKLNIRSKFYRKELFGSVKNPEEYPDYPKDVKDKVFNLNVKMCDKEYNIPCRANENMIVALERAGIAGPNRCRGGVCGWCRSKLLKGDVYIPDFTDGRRQADKKWGYIHPCATFALSDCSIEVPNNK